MARTRIFAALSIPALVGACVHPVQPVGLADDVTLVPLGEGVWQHTAAVDQQPISNGLLVVGDGGAVLVDAGITAAQGARLETAVARRFGVPLVGLVVTGATVDRLRGVEGISPSITVYAAPSTVVNAGVRFEGRRVVPLEDGAGRSIAGVDFEVARVRGTHDGLAVWIPEAEVLFGGDAVLAAADQVSGEPLASMRAAWRDTVATLDARFAPRVVVPGDGLAGGPELLDHTLDVLGVGAGAPARAVSAPGE